MRSLGIGLLGLIGGLLAAIVLQDVLAHLLVDSPGRPSTLGRALGALLPVCGALGAALAIWLDRRHRRRSEPDGEDPDRGCGGTRSGRGASDA